MGNDPSHLEDQIGHIVRRLEDVERRLESLEASPRPPAHLPRAPDAAPVRNPKAGPAPRAAAMPTGISVALIGRTLVVLGGAFLLRAITESEVVSLGVGTTLGLLYALLWIAAADREAARRHPSSAGFHGLAASIIAFPLIWESTVHFELLPEVASAALLIGWTAAAVAVAWRRALRGLAWILMLGNATTAVGLAFVTKAFTPYMIDVLVLAFAMLWLGYAHGWRALAAFTAVVANITILLISSVLFLSAGDESRLVVAPLHLMLLQLALLLVYVGSVTGRVLVKSRDVDVLESVQAVAVTIIGLGGAVATLRQTGAGRELVACVGLGLALGGYAVVFSIIDRRVGSRANFIFFSTLALAFTIVGSSALATGTALVVVLGSAALLTAWIGASKERATLSLHGAVYALSAAGVADVMGRASHAFWGAADLSVAVTTPSTLLVLAMAAVCSAFRVAMHGRTWGRFSRIPKLSLIIVVVLCLGTITVEAGLRLLPTATAPAPDVAFVGVLRTAVLAVSAVILALVGRWNRLYEAILLVYPILVLGGLKLLLEDLRTGRPATLFASMVIYGSALIIAPRMARAARQARSSRSTGR